MYLIQKANKMYKVSVKATLRECMIFVIGLMLFLSPVPSANGAAVQLTQEAQDNSVQQLVMNKEMADKRQQVSMEVENEPLISALRRLAKEVQVGFSFQEYVIPVKKVTASLDGIPVYEALDILLEGTDLEVALSPEQDILIIREKLDQRLKIQLQTVGGTVTDVQSGETLPGVNVMIKGTTTGTSTGSDGSYELDAPSLQDTLIFSFVGYQTQEVPIEGRTDIDVALQPQAIAGEELVVVGYGTQQRRELTGSVSSVEGEDISVQAVSNPLEALSGLSSGTQVLQNSGQPGGEISVLIRGPNSVLGGTEPLYVVDGFPIEGDLSMIDPNNIQSIEVLKDASSTAIYGSRGANGVVLVTTKKGKAGKTLVEYSGYYGIQNVPRTIDLLNAEEFARLANERASNDGRSPYFSDSEIESFGEGFDWQEAIFQSAPIQNHSLRISGGNESTTFNISGSFFDQKGIIINSGFQRKQSKVKINHAINSNININLNSIFNTNQQNSLVSNNSERGSGVLSGALVAPPTISAYNDEGNYSDVRPYPFSPDILENPVAMARERKWDIDTKSLLLDLSATANITKNISLKSAIGNQYEIAKTSRYSPSIFQFSANGVASQATNESSNFVTENTLTYSGQDENNDLEILGGVSYQVNIGESLSASSTDFVTDRLGYYNLQSGSTPETPSTYYSKFKILSFFGRLNYSFKEKYLLSSSFRADGSSRFGENKKWAYFPSGSLGWIISEENFWDDTFNVVNLFKIRASIGKTGNTGISPYQSLTLLNSGRTVFDGQTSISFAPPASLANPDLKWETTTQFDVGLDIGLFENRLSATFDYYHKETNDLLASVPLASSTGYSITTENLGKIQNKGFEFSINSNISRGQNFSWSIGANFGLNRNKVLKLASGDVLGANLGNVLPAMSIVREGQPLGAFYGFVEDGLTEDGNIKYQDFDGDGTRDRTIIGNPNPDYTFGLNSSISYRKFKLDIHINGEQGNDILNYNLGTLADGFAFGSNQIQDIMGNYWAEENPDPNATYPRISSDTRYLASDRFIEDGSYIKIQNLKLSYTFEDNQYKFLPVTNTQIYLSGQNLITFTDYSFYSPQVNTRGAGISKGIDQYGYPHARTLTVGLNIQF